MSQFPWCNTVRYLGKDISACSLPWHYKLVWIGATTPLVYLFYACIGWIRIAWNTLHHFSLNSAVLLREWIFLLWFWVPIVAVIILKSPVYDGWRHHFFVYPALILASLIGFQSLWNWLKLEKSLPLRIIGECLMIAGVLLSMMVLVFWMVTNHPHQNVYFNELFNRNFDQKFELDYWGTSYKQGLEYVLKNDNRSQIKIALHESVGNLNLDILSAADRNRLQAVGMDQAEYFLTYRRNHYGPYPYPLWHSIVVDSVHILDIYKMKASFVKEAPSTLHTVD